MYLKVSEETGDYYLLLYTTLYFVIVLRVHITPFKYKVHLLSPMDYSVFFFNSGVDFAFFPHFNNSFVVIHIIMIILFIILFKPCTLLEMIPNKMSMNTIFIFV